MKPKRINALAAPLWLALCALLAVSASHATRVIESLERSYEVGLPSVTLPRSVAGTVIFRTCDQCDVQALRVNATTEYRVNQVAVSFDEFHHQFDLSLEASADRSMLIVHAEIRGNQVARMHLRY